MCSQIITKTGEATLLAFPKETLCNFETCSAVHMFTVFQGSLLVVNCTANQMIQISITKPTWFTFEIKYTGTKILLLTS